MQQTPAPAADSEWRNRTEHVKGRPQIIDLLKRKWERELDYRYPGCVWYI